MRHQALANAVLLRGELRVPTAYIPIMLTHARLGPEHRLARLQRRAAGTRPRRRCRRASCPQGLKARVLAGSPSQQLVSDTGRSRSSSSGCRSRRRTTTARERPPTSRSSACPISPRPCRPCLAALTLAALITTVAGAIARAAGRPRRALRPLHETTRAALAIAGGQPGHPPRERRLRRPGRARRRLQPAWWTSSKSASNARPASAPTSTTSSAPRSRPSPTRSRSSRRGATSCRRRALQALDLLGAEVRRFRRLVDELLGDLPVRRGSPATSPATR